MELILPFAVKPPVRTAAYEDKIFFIGSCFSTDIAERLHRLKFSVFSNPTGIVYHPLNIATALDYCVLGKDYDEGVLIERNGIFYSWLHHSAFSGLKKEDVLKRINENNQKAHQFLKTAQYLIISPATAFAYYLHSQNSLVANCHKMPAKDFEKRLTGVEEMTARMSESLARARNLNPQIQLVFTVSPVKHLRDGVIQNNLSKAIVLQSIHQLENSFSHSWYFPSFEILNDELRDYRFYKNDFAHPNELAVDYILEKFLNVFFNDQARALLSEVRGIVAAAKHQPLAPESEEYKQFCRVQINRMESLENKFAFLNFSEEKHFLSFS